MHWGQQVHPLIFEKQDRKYIEQFLYPPKKEDRRCQDPVFANLINVCPGLSQWLCSHFVQRERQNWPQGHWICSNTTGTTSDYFPWHRQLLPSGDWPGY